MRKTKPKEFRWGTHFKNGKLYVFEKRSVLVARPWPELRAWRLTTRRRLCQPVRPEINVQTPAVYSQGTPRCAYPPSEWAENDPPPTEDAPPAAEATPEDQSLTAWVERKLETSRVACAEFFAPMPEPVRRQLQPFTSILHLIQHHDALAARLNREGVPGWGNLQSPPAPAAGHGRDHAIANLRPAPMLMPPRLV